jgi:hypothetical protein
LARSDEDQRSGKNHLRLEIEKLRRGEGEWLQVMVRVLDHVQALHLAGQRSGQRNLIEQLTHFQNSCRDNRAPHRSHAGRAAT